MKIFVTSNLGMEIMSPLSQGYELTYNPDDRPLSREEIIARISDKNGLLCTITDKIDSGIMDCAPNLKIISNFGVGYDNIDLTAATNRGVMVSNTPGVLTDATADLTFGLILSVARRIVEGHARIRANQWGPWRPFDFLGNDVTGKIIGIIGLGQIGKEVARRARAFKMPVIYHNRNRLTEAEEIALGAKFVDFETLLKEADFVSLHVSLNNESRGLIGKRELALMKPTAYLINVSRGPVIKEEDLVEALRNKRIAGAGLDVYEKEPLLAPGLSDMANAVLTPHIGSATIQTRISMGKLAVKNLLAGLSGQAPPNCLNWSEIANRQSK